MESLLEQLERKPDDFDWVSARAECSAAVIFEKLKILIESDVKTMNSLRKKDTLLFRSEPVNDNCFVVVGENQLQRKHKSVRFTLAEGAITIDGPEKNRSIKATVTFSDDGICRAKVSDKERDLWQLRKMALEDLFFNQ